MALSILTGGVLHFWRITLLLLCGYLHPCLTSDAFRAFRALWPFSSSHLNRENRDGPQILERKAEFNFLTELNGYYSIIKFYSLWMRHFPVSFRSLPRSYQRGRARIYRGASWAPPPRPYIRAHALGVLPEWLNHTSLTIHHSNTNLGKHGVGRNP